MKKLTPKQEKFCLYYHENGNAYEAYKHAYNAANMKRATIDKRAFDLLQKGAITGRLDQLKAESQDQTQYKVSEAFKDFQDVKVRAKAAGDLRAEILAINNIVSLLGLKVEATQTQNHTVQIVGGDPFDD